MKNNKSSRFFSYRFPNSEIPVLFLTDEIFYTIDCHKITDSKWER